MHIGPSAFAFFPVGRRQRRRAARLTGFTILEVMFAAAVMVLAITTSITTMQHAFMALDTARKITLAGQIMQSAFERMRLDDWGTVTSYAASEDITGAVNASFSASSAITSTFTVSRSVTTVHADMKQITLTTSWKSYDGRVLSRSFTTYYGRNGLYDYFYNSY